MNSKRKIIQIIGGMDMHALCDDGTVWTWASGTQDKTYRWWKCTDIPEDENNE